MLEHALVVKKVGNGFMVRSLSDEMNDKEIDDNTFVFAHLWDVHSFLEQHFGNLEKEGDTQSEREDTQGDGAQPILTHEESAS